MANHRWLGRYRLEEPLGRGSMGEVWRAHDEVLGRQVALKLLPEQVAAEGTIEGERLLREAHAAAQVEHPNVVAMYDVDRAEGRPFLVMEALDGRTLAAELAERGPLPPDDVQEIWRQVSAGLDAAHNAGVVHRDVKPSNLIRTADGGVKVVDFGLADDGWGARLTHSGTFMGTAAYAAPERILGEPGDARSDLYSLGCVLYELLTGRPPFPGDLLAQTYAHVHTDPVPVTERRSDVPADLGALVMGLLSKDPAVRPPAGTVAMPVARRSRSLLPLLAGLGTAGLAAALTLAWIPTSDEPGGSVQRGGKAGSETSGPTPPSPHALVELERRPEVASGKPTHRVPSSRPATTRRGERETAAATGGSSSNTKPSTSSRRAAEKKRKGNQNKNPNDRTRESQGHNGNHDRSGRNEQ